MERAGPGVAPAFRSPPPAPSDGCPAAGRPLPALPRSSLLASRLRPAYLPKTSRAPSSASAR